MYFLPCSKKFSRFAVLSGSKNCFRIGSGSLPSVRDFFRSKTIIRFDRKITPEIVARFFVRDLASNFLTPRNTESTQSSRGFARDHVCAVHTTAKHAISYLVFNIYWGTMIIICACAFCVIICACVFSLRDSKQCYHLCLCVLC